VPVEFACLTNFQSFLPVAPISAAFGYLAALSLSNDKYWTAFVHGGKVMPRIDSTTRSQLRGVILLSARAHCANYFAQANIGSRDAILSQFVAILCYVLEFVIPRIKFAESPRRKIGRRFAEARL